MSDLTITLTGEEAGELRELLTAEWLDLASVNANEDDRVRLERLHSMLGKLEDARQ